LPSLEDVLKPVYLDAPAVMVVAVTTMVVSCVIMRTLVKLVRVWGMIGVVVVGVVVAGVVMVMVGVVVVRVVMRSMTTARHL
jgi:hypothetical protein